MRLECEKYSPAGFEDVNCHILRGPGPEGSLWEMRVTSAAQQARKQGLQLRATEFCQQPEHGWKTASSSR